MKHEERMNEAEKRVSAAKEKEMTRASTSVPVTHDTNPNPNLKTKCEDLRTDSEQM